MTSPETTPAPVPQLSPAEMDARYRGPLMSYFQRRLTSYSEAEDLTQEVFLRLARRAGDESDEIADGFIFTIAANLLRDRVRRGRSRQVSKHVEWEADEGRTSEALINYLGPERILEARELLGLVVSTLDSVSPRTRDIFLLYRLEGMRQREIADIFGITPSAVEKHIAKALHRLVEAGV